MHNTKSTDTNGSDQPNLVEDLLVICPQQYGIDDLFLQD